MSEPAFDEKIVALSGALAAAGIDHAFGGAIAVAYYGVVRGTEDIDVNVFLPPGQADRVRRAIEGLGVTDASDASDAPEAPAGSAPRPDVMVLDWGRVQIHVFLAYHPLHESCRERVRSVPLGDARIPILGPEDIVIFKTLYDRRQDRVEVREVLICTSLDTAYVSDWLDRIAGPDDPRALGFRSAVSELV